MRPHVAAGLGTSAVAAFFGAGLPYIDSAGGYAGLSQRFLPTIVTIGLAVCALLLLLVRDAVPALAEDAADAIDLRRGPGRLARVAAGLLLHMALIGLAGFVIASTLLMILVARAYGSDRILRDASAALAITIPMWLVFSRLLGIPLALLPVAGF